MVYYCKTAIIDCHKVIVSADPLIVNKLLFICNNQLKEWSDQIKKTTITYVP